MGASCLGQGIFTLWVASCLGQGILCLKWLNIFWSEFDVSIGGGQAAQARVYSPLGDKLPRQGIFTSPHAPPRPLRAQRKIGNKNTGIILTTCSIGKSINSDKKSFWTMPASFYEAWRKLVKPRYFETIERLVIVNTMFWNYSNDLLSEKVYYKW